MATTSWLTLLGRPGAPHALQLREHLIRTPIGRVEHGIHLVDGLLGVARGRIEQLELLGRSPDARIVFASGHADSQREALVRGRGAHAFLQKPYEIDLLVSTIHQVVRQTPLLEERTLGGGRR